MNESEELFFIKNENAKNLRALSKALSKLDLHDPLLDLIAKDLNLMINSFLSDAKFYDISCQSNISWIGNSFMNEIQRFLDTTYAEDKSQENLGNNIKSIFVSAYRFLCEADFCTPNGLNMELAKIKIHVDERIELFNNNNKQQLIFANYIMPAQITKRLLNLPNFQEIKSYNEKYNQAEKFKNDWDLDISKKESAVLALKEKLDEYKTGFNFVGLYKGFDNLSSEKVIEKNWALGFLFFLDFSH